MASSSFEVSRPPIVAPNPGRGLLQSGRRFSWSACCYQELLAARPVSCKLTIFPTLARLFYLSQKDAKWEILSLAVGRLIRHPTGVKRRDEFVVRMPSRNSASPIETERDDMTQTRADDRSIDVGSVIGAKTRYRPALPPLEARDWLTPAGTARALGCSVATVHRLRRGVIPGIKALPYSQNGRKIIFRKVTDCPTYVAGSALRTALPTVTPELPSPSHVIHKPLSSF